MRIINETGVHGSAIAVSNVIQMVEKQQTDPYTHAQIKDLFSLDRQVLLTDL